MRGFWTCQRVAGGVKCSQRNANRKRKCQRCGKPRPARKPPAHMAALELPYAHYVELNGGEWCGICGTEQRGPRRLHRDHDHRSGRPRGILCFRCNAALRPYMDLEWLRGAVEYLERTTETCDCCGKEASTEFSTKFYLPYNARFCGGCAGEIGAAS